MAVSKERHSPTQAREAGKHAYTDWKEERQANNRQTDIHYSGRLAGTVGKQISMVAVIIEGGKQAGVSK